MGAPRVEQGGDAPLAAGAPCEEFSHLPRHEQGCCGAVFNLLWIFYFRLHTFNSRICIL